jgi:hypothetical protein
MSGRQGRGDDKKRRKREEKKRERQRYLESKRVSGNTALSALVKLFNENTATIIELATVEGLDDAVIAERLGVKLSEVEETVHLFGRLPVAISDLLLKHPEVLKNPEALKAIIAGVRGKGS